MVTSDKEVNTNPYLGLAVFSHFELLFVYANTTQKMPFILHRVQQAQFFLKLVPLLLLKLAKNISSFQPFSTTVLTLSALALLKGAESSSADQQSSFQAGSYVCSAPNAQKEQIALKLARLCQNCLSSNNQEYYWRHSKETAKEYRCKNQRNRATSNDICKGCQPSSGRQLQSEEIDNMYCDANHRGPLQYARSS